MIYDKAGEVVLQENVRDLDAHTTFRSLPVGFTSQDGKFRRSNETFALSPVSPGEAFYGFGEKFTRLNKLGQRIKGWNANPFGAGTEEAHKNIPFFMSTKGYGIFVNTTYRVTYDMCSRSLMAFTVMVEDPRLDIFIIYGPGLKDVLARYEKITGWPSLPPRESFGISCGPYIWEIENVTENMEEAVVALARKFGELDIPVDHFIDVNMLETVSVALRALSSVGELDPPPGGTLKKSVNSQAVYALSETTRAQGPREEIHRLWEREALGAGRSQGRSGTSWRTGFEVRSRS